MFLNDHWTFLVDLAGDPPLATRGVCLVDLSSDDDRGGIEPSVDTKTGILSCTLGCQDRDGHEARNITQVWEYKESAAFNGRFPVFDKVSLVDFVRRVCDAAKFDGYTEKAIEELKRDYHVL